MKVQTYIHNLGVGALGVITLAWDSRSKRWGVAFTSTGTADEFDAGKGEAIARERLRLSRSRHSLIERGRAGLASTFEDAFSQATESFPASWRKGQRVAPNPHFLLEWLRELAA